MLLRLPFLAGRGFPDEKCEIEMETRKETG